MVQKLKKAAIGNPRNSIRHVLRRQYRPLAEVWSFIIWVVGILVSLAVGFGMTEGTLIIPYVPDVVIIFAGWVVIILTLLGVLLKIIDKVSG